MALPRNLVLLIDALRRAWPQGRTAEALGRELDVHDWRVSELLGRCEQLGVPLEHDGASLRLNPAELPLIGDVIEHGLETKRVGRSVIVFAETASTNNICWQAAPRRDSDGLVVAAETQTAGRGRLGRSWLDRPGQSLLFSTLLLDEPAGEGLANRLMMSASVALAGAIADVLSLPATIRWPNDIYLDGRKAAGILLESRKASNGLADVVLGVGVNCNQPRDGFDGELAGRATSLSAEAGRAVDRTALLRAILSRLDERLASDADDARLHADYLERMDPHARRVRIAHNGRSLEATVRDVDPIAGLIVELPGGGIAHFTPSQVSLEWLDAAQ